MLCWLRYLAGLASFGMSVFLLAEMCGGKLVSGSFFVMSHFRIAVTLGVAIVTVGAQKLILASQVPPLIPLALTTTPLSKTMWKGIGFNSAVITPASSALVELL